MVRNPRSVAVGDDKLFHCDQANCGKRFKKFINFEAHRLLHAGSRPFKCSYEGCAAAYTRNQHLTRHISTCHKKKEGSYKCQAKDCLATFETNESLCQHFRRAHYGSTNDKSEQKLKCEQCEEEFTSISKLQHHVTSSHRFQCGTCNRTFVSKLLFKKHESRHESNNNEKQSKTCTVCNLNFENYAEFKEHRATSEHIQKQGDSLTCPNCGKSFNHLGNFNLHVQVHSKERNVFRCTHDNCDKSYYFLKNLRHHIRVAHEADRHPQPKCLICSKTFSSKHRLVKHLQSTHVPTVIKTTTERTNVLHSSSKSRSSFISSFAGNQGSCGRDLLKPKRQIGKLLTSDPKIAKEDYETLEVLKGLTTQES